MMIVRPAGNHERKKTGSPLGPASYTLTTSDVRRAPLGCWTLDFRTFHGVNHVSPTPILRVAGHSCRAPPECLSQKVMDGV